MITPEQKLLEVLKVADSYFPYVLVVIGLISVLWFIRYCRNI